MDKVYVEVKGIRFMDNHYTFSKYLILKMSFWDRLMFLIFGESCLIEVPYKLLK